MSARSYLSPKTHRGVSRNGRGVFAITSISAGELIIDFTDGPGALISSAEANRLFEQGNDYMIQVDDDVYFAVTKPEELEDVDLVNHSCDPNCGMNGNYKIVACRDIASGEEITIDYAMLENSDYELDCRCGTALCRRLITGFDWRDPSLQKKYHGYFTDYIADKIRSLASH